MNDTAKKEKKLVIKGLAAICAGVLNGALGTGGGIIILALCTLDTREEGLDGKEAFARTVLCMIPMTLISAFIYTASNDGVLLSAMPYLPVAAIGGILGGMLLDRVKTGFVRVLFSVLLIAASAVSMVRAL